MRTFTFAASVTLFATLCAGLLRAEDSAPIFDVPRVDNITIDGMGDDWGDRGFCVNLMPDEHGKLKPVADLDASFRLGWDDRGLLVLVNVTDDITDEAKNNELWYGDSVELFYAPKKGAPDVVQMVISPGVDPQRPKLRSILQDERTSEELRKTPVTATAVRTKKEHGYTLEVLLPSSNFAIKPEAGRELAFQMYVNDSDGGSSRFQALWYPISGAHDSTKMNRIRLSDKPGPAINTTVTANYEKFRQVVAQVAATPDFAGKTFAVKDGDHELAKGTLAATDGRAGGKIVLPMPSSNQPYTSLSLAVEGEAPRAFSLPDLKEARAKAFMDQELDFSPNVFADNRFPKCEFEQPSYVEDLIGPYTISTTFYDADYNPVTAAEKPGRYGAVVEIKTEDGRTFRRLRTLFRMPEAIPWYYLDMAGVAEFPKQTGINPVVTAQQKFSIARYLKQLAHGSVWHDSWSSITPALMSDLYETKPGTPDATVFNDFLATDRQWWVGLKRKLSGADKLYPGPFVCPQIVKEKPATVLHKGTPAEAGMKEGTAEKIDALLKQWAADSDEAFAVCVARHGVIVLHKAYGMRDGKPMTVDTQSWMASITKVLSGASMMMLVDQGLVNLDDPVTKFLPEFRGVTVPTPLTIRHLYTHTNGLQGHWGDDLNDFEDIIAGYYPTMSIGTHHEYNGAGIALGSKILETITGEALPQFYKHHLLDPLGCTHTDVTNSASNAESTPMDIAKVGQMLLNRGSYGDKRFMSPDTFQQMLPVKLTKVLGPDTTVEWGIGLVWYKTDGISNTTFGHGSAASATLRIDPEHDLVITMTRNAAGRNFTEYHKKLLAMIMENITK